MCCFCSYLASSIFELDAHIARDHRDIFSTSKTRKASITSSDVDDFPSKKPKVKENPINPEQTQRSPDQFKSDQESNQAQIIPESKIKIEQIPAIDLSENIINGNKKDLTKLSVTQNRCSTQSNNKQTQKKTRKNEDNLQSTEEYCYDRPLFGNQVLSLLDKLVSFLT